MDKELGKVRKKYTSEKAMSGQVQTPPPPRGSGGRDHVAGDNRLWTWASAGMGWATGGRMHDPCRMRPHAYIFA